MSPPTGEPREDLPQTSWTLLSAAQGHSPEAAEALEAFTHRYYQAIYAYIAAITRSKDRTEDLVQGFFTKVVFSGRLLTRLDRAKGSFRPFLKQALRNYIIDEWRGQERQKRRAPETQLRPDGWHDGWDRLAPQSSPSPDAAFHAAWVRALLDEALARVRAICESKGQTEHFTVFLSRYLSESSPPPSWEELGKAYGLDGKAARNRAETVSRHFRLVLREMLIDEIGSERAADEEIVTLLAFL